ncbi:MAG TPA: ABC transporter ATP-binding protein [Candidatus Udaeobacter sp.]|nr:ABC transporter ATP-binding protein [Candidatus Udaeobacter sp.]
MTLTETEARPASRASSEPAIRTRALRKVYPLPGVKRGKPARPTPGSAPAPSTAPAPPTEVVALQGLDLEIAQGEFFGLLGPNGAGKTTTIGILTTRVRPTDGQAFVSGCDVVKDSVAVRRRIGVMPQRPNPDRQLSVRENLVFHACYFGVPAAVANARATELLGTFEIADRAASKVEQLSGGQQQRLMIARALIHDPEVMFLDEPTVGLDPLARHALWSTLRRIHSEGRTIVMTTHYMEEADQLCERVAIVDRGRLLALDTPANLKAQAPGGTLIELTLDGDATGACDLARALPGILRCESQQAVLRAFAERGGESIAGLIRAAENAGRSVRDVHFAPPSLETLFISMTGRRLE